MASPSPTENALDWVYVTPTLLLESGIHERFPYLGVKVGNAVAGLAFYTTNRGRYYDMTVSTSLRGYAWFTPDQMSRLGRDIRWHRLSPRDSIVVRETPDSGGSSGAPAGSAGSANSSDSVLVFLVEAVMDHNDDYGVSHYYTRWYEAQLRPGRLEVRRYAAADGRGRKIYQLTSLGYGSVAIHRWGLSVRVPGQETKLDLEFSPVVSPPQWRWNFTTVASEYGYAFARRTTSEYLGGMSPDYYVGDDPYLRYLVYYDRWPDQGDREGKVERGFIVCRQLPVFYDHFVRLVLDDESVVVVDLTTMRTTRHPSWYLDQDLDRLRHRLP